MKLIILPSADEVADWTAKYVSKKINDFRANENKYFVIGLPTGKCSNTLFLLNFHIMKLILFKCNEDAFFTFLTKILYYSCFLC